jgi:TatD DNase family protein
MTIIDTHAHLYSEEFQVDIDLVIERAQKVGVSKMYLPAIDSSETASMLALEEKFPGICIAMMGLHPCYVKENVASELAHVRSWLDQRDFVAIGEIGLDFYWDKTFTNQQYEAFDTQMQWALELNRPIVIHTRNAMQETINRVKPFAQKGLKGIFHCFSGSAESAKQIIDLGFLLGIGGVITYKNAGLPEVLETVGLEHLVLETDAPYLTPVPFRGKRNECSYLTYIISKLSEAKAVSELEVAAVTTANAEQLFHL